MAPPLRAVHACPPEAPEEIAYLFEGHPGHLFGGAADGRRRLLVADLVEQPRALEGAAPLSNLHHCGSLTLGQLLDVPADLVAEVGDCSGILEAWHPVTPEDTVPKALAALGPR